MKHCTIPIFVPHLGCPCACSFCNQKTITGVMPMTPVGTRAQIEGHLATVSPGTEVEIAFFGGSFTAIPRPQMEALLRVALPYLKAGKVSGIRISTRPDAIDPEICDLLSAYGVTTVELGIQSMDDAVLERCNRGHSAAHSRAAIALLLSRGFRVGGQMMVGLPSSTPASETLTARTLAELGVQEARIYPVVVFAGTHLAEEAAARQYRPLTVREAAERCAEPLEILLDAGVKLLRVGLCESESLHAAGQIVGGAYHPALGELCYNALYRRRMVAALSAMNLPPHANLKISVAPGKLSMAIGQKRCNHTFLADTYPIGKLQFSEDPSLAGYGVRVDLLD